MKSLGKMVKALVKIGVIALLFLVIAIQFIPYGRNHSNPPVIAEPQWDSSRTRELFFRACADCHSNETVWPWYSNIAPISWLVERDVREGRAAFNISEWGTSENEGDDSAETVQNGSMPPWFYTVAHPSSRLSEGERRELINGLKATFGGEEDNGEESKFDDEEDNEDED